MAEYVQVFNARDARGRFPQTRRPRGAARFIACRLDSPARLVTALVHFWGTWTAGVMHFSCGGIFVDFFLL